MYRNSLKLRRGLSLLLSLVMIVSFIFPIITPSAVEESGASDSCEIEEHTHTKLNGCYEDDIEYLCGNENHEHIETCTKHNYMLICDLEEHTHTDECLVNSVGEECLAEDVVDYTSEEDVTEISETYDLMPYSDGSSTQKVYNTGDLIPCLINFYLPTDGSTSILYQYKHYDWDINYGDFLEDLGEYEEIISTDDSIIYNGKLYQGVLKPVNFSSSINYACNAYDIDQKLGTISISSTSSLGGEYECYLRKDDIGYYVEWLKDGVVCSHDGILDIGIVKEESEYDVAIPEGELPIAVNLTVITDSLSTPYISFVWTYCNANSLGNLFRCINYGDTKKLYSNSTVSSSLYCIQKSGLLTDATSTLYTVRVKDSSVDKPVARISTMLGYGAYDTYDLYLRKNEDGYHIGYKNIDSGIETLDVLNTTYICKTTKDFSDEDYNRADLILSSMSTEEKVGQLFLCHYPGEGAGTVADAANMIDNYHVGGFVSFAPMFQNSNPTDVKEKISKTQAESKIPLIMSIDEEGGNVTRVSQFPVFRSEKFHSASEFNTLTDGDYSSQIISDEVAEKSAFLKELGFNLNHDPVADVATSGYMYDRGRVWGVDAVSTAGFVANDVYNAEIPGIGSTLKHFPGYGSTSSDTHKGFAISSISLNDLWKSDLLPFAAGMNSGSMAVMVTHNMYEGFNNTNLEPASLSSFIYGTLLRNCLGFKGLAITDDLGMAAITSYVGSGNEALSALKAGADMCILSDIGANYNTVLNAVNAGELKIDDKVRRILAYKLHKGIINEENDIEVGKIYYKTEVPQGTEYESFKPILSISEETVYAFKELEGCTIRFDSKYDKYFLGWFNSDGELVSSDKTFTPSNLDGCTTYSARFYTASATATPSPTSSPSPSPTATPSPTPEPSGAIPVVGGNTDGGYVSTNGDILVAEPKIGHIFLGWYLDNELVSADTEFNPKEELPDLDYTTIITFEARFSDWIGGGAVIYFQASEGGTIVGDSQRIVQGEEESFVGPVAVPNSGYSFVGWANSVGRIVSREVRPTVYKPEEGWQTRIYTAVFANITKGTITAEYYAYIDESVISDDSYKVTTSGTNTNEVFSINTLGRRSPVNGTGISISPNVNALRVRYVNVDKTSPDYGTLAKRRVLQVMYHSQKLSLVGGVVSDAIDSFNNSSYRVKELWVSKDETDLSSVNESDWDVIPYVKDMVFMLIGDDSATREGIEFYNDNESEITDTYYDSVHNVLYLKDDAIVRFVADYINTSTDLPVTFYDYDISDGNRYLSASAAYSQTNPQANGNYLYTYRSGINSMENYSDKGLNSLYAHLAFGNGNAGSGWNTQKWTGNPDTANNSLNQANRTPISGSTNHSYRLRTYGLVQGLADGKINWSKNVVAPELFDSGEAIGKTVLTDYSLHMEGTGNNYTLTAVNGTSLTNLNRLTNTTNGSTTYYHIFSNDFWPSDEFPTAGAEGHDPMFGGTTYYTTIGGNNATDILQSTSVGQLPPSDNGKPHNAYFGMQFKFKIRLDASYVGPMNYYFYGDDDMWIFMDDTLIGDIGGVGQSTGLYVDFWDWVDKEKEKIHIHDEKCYDENAELVCGYTDYKEYTLSVYYTERGASGSTCYMSFNVPSFVSVPVQFYGNMKLNKDVVLTDGKELGTLANQEFPIKIDFQDQLGNVLETGITYTGTKQGTYYSGDELLISNNDNITLLNIPSYTTYTVSEIDPGGFTPTYVNETGEIGWNETSEVTIINTGTSDSILPNTDVTKMPKTGWIANRFIVPWSISAICGLLLLLLNKKSLLVV